MAEEAIEQTRDLSRALRSDEAAGGLEAALSELLSGLVPPGMTHELSVEGEVEEAAAQVREQLFLVLREAVRNAVTHSGASTLRVEIRTTGKGSRASCGTTGGASTENRANGPKPGDSPTWPNAPRCWAAPVRSSRPLAKERAWRRASRLTALSVLNAVTSETRACRRTSRNAVKLKANFGE